MSASFFLEGDFAKYFFFLPLHCILCRRHWRHVRPGSLRWSSSSSSSRSSSWRAWKMPQHGPYWENLSTCCWPSWLSFWSLSQLWPTVWFPWWRHARARSPPSSSSSCWPSCGETGTLSLGSHTVLCSLQDDQIEAGTCCFVDTRRCNCSCSHAGSLKNVIAVRMAARPGTENSAVQIQTRPEFVKRKKQSQVEDTHCHLRRTRLFTFLKLNLCCCPSQNATSYCFYL